jgi:hypothetical protein
MRLAVSVVAVTASVIIAAGCGESIGPDQRIERCLSKQPDATEADCSQWEKDAELNDNGTHRGHENM